MNARTPVFPSKTPNMGTTIFTVMSALATEHQAVNLGQGFPDFGCDPRLLQAVTDAMLAGHNQYPPMAGIPALREAISAKVEAEYGRRYDAGTEITITAGATQAILTAVLWSWTLVAIIDQRPAVAGAVARLVSRARRHRRRHRDGNRLAADITDIVVAFGEQHARRCIACRADQRHRLDGRCAGARRHQPAEKPVAVHEFRQCHGLLPLAVRERVVRVEGDGDVGELGALGDRQGLAAGTAFDRRRDGY